MKIAIMESVVTPGGHEIDYDRILVEELMALGHEVEFYVPEGHEFKWNYGVPVHTLPGRGISYAGKKGMKKWWLSGKREYNRQRWYRKLYQYAGEKRFDALIFPSATYRYLRALQFSPLREAKLPVLFVIHGLTPTETTRLAVQVEKVKHNVNIKTVVQTFAKEDLARALPGVNYINPPNYIPRDIELTIDTSIPEVLKLGFFGQYRKEKNLDILLDAFFHCDFTRKVKLIVQGATQTEADALDFERLIAKYSKQEDMIEFQHRALIGKDWQLGISSVDALVMPYGNERYRYHTSAMLSNAIGFYKPVIIADIINPEVLQKYTIGSAFCGDNMNLFQEELTEFVNNFDDNKAKYLSALEQANRDFSPRKLAQNLADIAQGG